MLNDESYDVRVAALKPTAKFIVATNAETISVFLPALKNLSIDMKWRVRIEVLNTIIEIALSLKVLEIYKIRIWNSFRNQLNHYICLT